MIFSPLAFLAFISSKPAGIDGGLDFESLAFGCATCNRFKISPALRPANFCSTRIANNRSQHKFFTSATPSSLSVDIVGNCWCSPSSSPSCNVEGPATNFLMSSNNSLSDSFNSSTFTTSVLFKATTNGLFANKGAME